MSENVRSTSCRPWITLTTIVAMLGFAGLVFAAPPVLNHKPAGAGAPKLNSAEPGNPDDYVPPQGNLNLAAVPANDTCAGAIEIFLNTTLRFTSVGAADDYRTPATSACYQGLPGTQVPTDAPGRDVVFKFTATDTDTYSFRLQWHAVTDDFRNQNGVLYLVDGGPGNSLGCSGFASNPVNCLIGANRAQSRALYSAVGSTDNHGEELACVPLTAGQVVYPVFDDMAAGNAGSSPQIEVIKCRSEVEPNDTIATANPYICDIQGSSDVASTAHCHLGSKDGLACTRTGILSSTFVGQTDADCDPRCIGGPNAGLSCITNTGCNPTTDVGAICAGVCVDDSVCTGGPTPGAACTATCSGGPRAGLFCAVSHDAASAVSIPITGTGIFIASPVTITGCGAGFACVQNLSCGAGGSCDIRNNEGDVDFFDLGSVAAGSKIFTAIDANTSNDNDWRMRVTDGTNTLGFDDDDGNSKSGTRAPVVAGAIATGGETYVRVSRTTPRLAEPYHLNAIVRPPIAAAQLEDDNSPFGGNNTYFYWPSNTVVANPITAGGYVKGHFTALDSDCFKFCVNKGDLMHWYGDGNPVRSTPPSLAQLAQPIYYDSDSAGTSNFIFGAEPRRSVLPTAPSAGLNGLTPSTTSSYEDYRATYTGEVEVCFYEPSSRVTPAPIPGYAPGNWAGSLGVNCGPVDDCTTNCASITATKTVSPGPYNDGDIVTYTITVHNEGPGIAADVHLQDFLDPNTVFVSLSIKDGFDKNGDGVEGDNTACFLLPTPGQNDAFVDCINASMAPGTTTTYTLKVQVNNCIGPVDVFNGATIDTRSPNCNASSTCDVLNIFTGEIQSLPCENPSVGFSTTDNGSCNDLVCDAVSCTVDLCTDHPRCDANSVCTGSAVVCDDHCVCTDDSCDPAVGCVFDSSQQGDLCNNAGNDHCLKNICYCDSGCGTVPVDCDDHNACTDDSCNHDTGCVHTTHDCNDNTVCTTDTCNPQTGCVFTPISCDDGNCCTNDACDPITGCFHTPNTTPPTFTTQPSLGPCAILWPPEHGYVDFSLATTGVTATSQCGLASIGFASCQSSQEQNAHGTGDGNSTWDCAYSANTLSLRAERDGACSPLGRVYTSSVSATDVCGNTTVSNSFDVGVWHDRGHGPRLPHFSANPGSNQNDTREGVPGFVNGNYGLGCGPGINPSCDEIGQQHDTSDADPEAEINQNASISVGDLHISKNGGSALLTWSEPAHQPGVNVTRFHVYRLDPVTLFWTMLAEVSKQTTSYLDPVLSDGVAHQYKIAAVIKP